MSKGIAPILATVLVVLVVISLAGAFLLYSQRATTQLTETGTQEQQRISQQLQTTFSIESVANSQIVVRNRGERSIESGSLTVFIDEELVNHTQPSSIAPGAVGTLYLNGTSKLGLGDRTLRVASTARSDSIRVRVEKPLGNVLDLRFEEETRDLSTQANNGKFFGDARLLVHLDEGSGIVAKDATSYANDGTLTNGPTWATGVSGTAISLDGSNDYIDTPYRVQAGPRSIFFWIQYNSLTGPGGFALTGTQQTGAYSYTGIQNGGQGYAYVTDNGGTYNYSFATGRWYFVGFTVDGSKVRHYVDGVLVGTRNPNTESSSTVPYYIGRVEAGHNINGLIDEVLVYARNLTDAEVLELNSSRKAKQFEYVTGPYGKALKLDGADDYVNVSNAQNFNITDTITVSVWIKTTDSDTDNERIVSKYYCCNGGASDNVGYELNYRGSDDYLNWQLRFTSTSAMAAEKTGLNINDGNWHHVIANYDRVTANLYVDGTRVASVVNSTAIGTTNTPVTIGKRSGVSSQQLFFNGSIDEVRIYDRSYTPDDLYAVGKA